MQNYMVSTNRNGIYLPAIRIRYLNYPMLDLIYMLVTALNLKVDLNILVSLPWWIWILSIAIPLAVAGLFTVKIPGAERLGFLPPVYATINAVTALLLMLAVYQIKKGNRVRHERLMTTAIMCSVLFLVLYIAYHITSDSTSYGGEGAMRYVYYFVLITHILLYVAVTGVIVYLMISPYY